MQSSKDETLDSVPLSHESVELYRQFWDQVGMPATTTAAPMDFLALQQGALEWGERLDLPAGVLAKFRQQVSAAQSDREVLALMEKFQQFSSVPPKGRASSEPPAAAPDSAKERADGTGAAGPSKQAQALACLTDHPSWTNKEIAAAIGVHVKSLSRWTKFNRARSLLIEKGLLPRGYRDKETGRLEAYSEESDDEEEEGVT